MKDNSSNQFNSIKKLTPELIGGYVKGTLSPERKAQVEKFLEDNPFEAEAIEGFKAQGVDITNDMSELDRRLSKTLDSEQSRSKWSWQIAAAVAFLAITGMVLYFYLPLELEQAPVAVNEAVQDTHDPDPSETKEETIIGDQSVEDRANPDPGDKLTNLPVPAQDANQINGLEKPSLKEENFDEEVAEMVEPSTDDPALNSSEPTPVGKATATTPLSLESEALRESIESSLLKQKRQKSVNRPASGVVADSELSIEGELLFATPPNGWEKYVKSQLDYPDSAKLNGVTGTVELIFQVNDAGQPSDFRIIKSLGYGCDQEAIRVVTDGPAWIPATAEDDFITSFGKVTLEFPPTE